MRRGSSVPGRAGPERVALATAGLVAIALAAGCGSVTYRGVGVASAHSARTGTPPHSSRASSLRLARRLLSKIVLPRGARRLAEHPLPAGLRQPADQIPAGFTVDIYGLYAVPLTMLGAFGFLVAHPVAGMTTEATGSTALGSLVTSKQVMQSARHLPRGISSATLTESIVPAPHGRAVMQADVQVLWFPPRPAAERITVSRIRAIRIRAELFGQRSRTVNRTFAQQAIIDRLAKLLNGLPVSPGGAYACPLEPARYQLTFEAVRGQPDVTVSTDGCPGDSVSVGGRAEPPLADFGKLVSLVNRILHVRPTP